MAYAAAGMLEAALTCWHISEFAQNNDDRHAGSNPRVASCVVEYSPVLGDMHSMPRTLCKCTHARSLCYFRAAKTDLFN